MRKLNIFTNRENATPAPHRGEIAETAILWAKKKKVKAAVAKKEGNQYRALIKRICQPVEWPPCMGCRDITVYYCQETGAECLPFRMYCNKGIDKEDNERHRDTKLRIYKSQRPDKSTKKKPVPKLRR